MLSLQPTIWFPPPEPLPSHLLSPSSTQPHLDIYILIHQLLFRLLRSATSAATLFYLLFCTINKTSHSWSTTDGDAAATSAAVAVFATGRQPPLLHKSAALVPAVQVYDTAAINMKGPGNLGYIKWRHPWDPEQIAMSRAVSSSFIGLSPWV
ncbi:hypothetical protein LXL04_016405 [Taraxacum kok-saghyz]